MIERYEFGKIIYKGKSYKSDLIITSNKIIFPWWRKEGHLLCLCDLEKVLSEDFEMFIIGQGYSSQMQISSEVLDYLNEKDKFSFFGSTTQAANVFNQYSKDRKIIGAFHLTC